MKHIVIEGLPAVGKSEALALLARFYPESVRVLPELVKDVVTRNGIDLFTQRDELTEAIIAEVPRRRQQVAEILDRGLTCLEESHLGVHWAYAQALGDEGFLEAYRALEQALPEPDAYVRFDIPIDVSVSRQQARGTPEFEIDRDRLVRMLDGLDQWHRERGTDVRHVEANRPVAHFMRDLEQELDLPYGATAADLENTFDTILLLGRPASGKSEFIDFMTRREAGVRARTWRIAPFDVIDDFPILWDVFREDDLWEALGQPRRHSRRADENYAVDDPHLWAFLIERINQVVGERSRDAARTTRIIEFSRGGSSGYRDALDQLSPEILRHAAILYVSVSFEESWRRNVARYDAKRRDGILTHSVPREEMEKTYGKDDWFDLATAPHGLIEVRGIQLPYVTMANEPESVDPEILGPRYHEALDPLFHLWRSLKQPSS